MTASLVNERTTTTNGSTNLNPAAITKATSLKASNRIVYNML
jgi:hypothetical protein